MLGIGGCACAAGGLGMVVAVAFGLTSSLSLVLPIAVYLAGLGMVLPQGIAGAMTPFPERAGAASSLFGFVQQSAAALCGAVVGWFLGSERLAARHRRGRDGLRDAGAVAGDARHPTRGAPNIEDSAATEQIVEQPAVEAAAARGRRTVGRDWLHRRGWRRSRSAAEQSGEQIAAVDVPGRLATGTP